MKYLLHSTITIVENPDLISSIKAVVRLARGEDPIHGHIMCDKCPNLSLRTNNKTKLEGFEHGEAS